MRHWVEILLIEPFSDGYPSVVGIFRHTETNGNSETAEDLERRHLAIALEDLRQLHPDLYQDVQAWHRTRDSVRAHEAFEWLEARIDQLLS